MELHTIELTVNGQSQRHSVEPRQHLVDFVRGVLGLNGSHLGCEHGVCGACTVEVDGRIVRGCLTLAVQAQGRTVRTIEGLSADGDVRDLQEAFVRHNALQCGFCTPGMVMATKELLEQKPDATRAEVREWMSGNYCRCTGYHAIVDAVCETLAARAGRRGAAR
ncbi:(2Fe-2S)-binding protein [Ramlibacter sp.]|uniref:(2Fe-2S)-binding protein n=1 Tax=Ramlibacter sp. TaxID=1917967 RepID=UPI00261B2D81|nr:(2Fe-2S)-binding protein [Ramlibacter sp.]MDB5958467.1 [2Fe-2S] binding domain protein [Ramlibacter sp.]